CPEVLMMEKISAYIIAYNEAEKIRAAINSVLWADEVVVVDSHSQDDTAKIAGEMGARVVQVEFNGFGDLRNQAMAACRYGWIFSLDSDERCTVEARDEILAVVRADGPADAYYIPRRNFFMGRWIKHSGFYPDYRQPQLFRKGVLHFLPDAVHERFEIRTDKPVGYLEKAIWQKPYKNFAEIQHKANRYSSLGASKLGEAGKRGSMTTAFVHALWAFFQLFILKKGFLDGWAGFVIAFGNFEGTFYKYAKLHELQAHWREPETPPLPRNS
ncbi:MAG: glycosyltransferase family 2 protein, partial [Candidatus Subteraquimicrobiales bacterium]|nr:glycosyltransferase family 2 protein [Candidatus Subteraquimicrobiales bacterium]